MFFVVVRFMENLAEWASTGRFPREELQIRWWIAALGIAVLLTLAVGLLVKSVD